MSMRDVAVSNLTQPPQLADWTDLPRRAWQDVQETAALIWEAWISLFPELQFWDPFGAALTSQPSCGAGRAADQSKAGIALSRPPHTERHQCPAHPLLRIGQH